MRLILFLMLFSLSLNAQEIISDVTELEVQQDSLYFVKRTVITDNQTSFPDTLITRTSLRGIEGARFYVEREAIKEQQRAAKKIAEAFEFNQDLQSFNSWRTLYTQLDSVDLWGRIGERYEDIYTGEWRVFDQAGNASWAESVLLPTGFFRLRILTERRGQWDGVNQYVLRARSQNNFLLVQFEGQNWEMIRSNQKGLESVFFPVGRIDRSAGRLRFVKIPN